MVFYPDEKVVKDLPIEGDNVWFTGTLLGYQYGDGITTGAGIGGYPYLLFKSMEPAELEKPTPSP